jgi:hypothetical protein
MRRRLSELQKRNLTQKPNWDFPISIRPRQLYLAACTHLSPSADINIPSMSGEMEQIQFLLGHVSVQTTEKYLGCKQRLRGAVNGGSVLSPPRDHLDVRQLSDH